MAPERGLLVGGGNTFRLASELHARGLLEPMREAVRGGAPFAGWSAGSNAACPGLFTTNDMPIVRPPSFDLLGLVPFQINPHYTEAQPPGHRGETRGQRIAEFLEMNREATVIGLPEGAWLEVEDEAVTLHGKAAKIFRHGADPEEVPTGEVTSLNAAD